MVYSGPYEGFHLFVLVLVYHFVSCQWYICPCSEPSHMSAMGKSGNLCGVCVHVLATLKHPAELLHTNWGAILVLFHVQAAQTGHQPFQLSLTLFLSLESVALLSFHRGGC